MAGDPTDVGCTPKNVVILNVEDIFCGGVNSDQITGGGVKDSFRFAGRAAGIKDVERVLTVDRNGRTIGLDVLHLAMPPHVAMLLDMNLVPCSAKHDHPFDRGGTA